MVIFLNFISNQYEKIPDLVDVYVKLYPVDANVPYVLYIKYLSQYKMIKRIDTSQELLYALLIDLKDFNNRWGSTIYAKELEKYNNHINDLVVLNNLRIAEFYQKRKEYFSAIKRLNILKQSKNYEQTNNQEMKKLIEQRINECFEALKIK